LLIHLQILDVTTASSRASKIKLPGTKQALPASYVLWWSPAYAHIREAAI
jgi:hypothetical protein